MDLSRIELDDEHSALLNEIRAFVSEHVTPEVLEHERATGDGYNEGLHLALGERGWIMPQWAVERGGAGFDRVSALLLRHELRRAGAPTRQMDTIPLIITGVEKYGNDELHEEVLMGVARGRIKLSLGFTEPHGGSDVASARTRAVRDGAEWIINGSKMFTTSAHFADYTFLLTRTDATLPKHKGLTMFLVPLKTPGADIQGIFTFSGERTNMVFYDDVRIADRYRLGEVNSGWSVIRESLDAEHGLAGRLDDGLDQLPIGANFLYEAHDALVKAYDWADRAEDDGIRPADDPLVVESLAQAAIQMEAAYSTNGAAGRVLGAETTDRVGSRLLELLGPEGLIDDENESASDGGAADYLRRFAQGTMTYGGSVEVFRTIIAQHDLGLPRMDFPGAKNVVTQGAQK